MTLLQTHLVLFPCFSLVFWFNPFKFSPHLKRHRFEHVDMWTALWIFPAKLHKMSIMSLREVKESPINTNVCVITWPAAAETSVFFLPVLCFGSSIIIPVSLVWSGLTVTLHQTFLGLQKMPIYCLCQLQATVAHGDGSDKSC